jgi:hypothetical protein
MGKKKKKGKGGGAIKMKSPPEPKPIMYKITFAIAFPVEFSFEYGFPVPGLATRVAICAISSAFLKYLVLVLRILNAAFGMSIKLSA